MLLPLVMNLGMLSEPIPNTGPGRLEFSQPVNRLEYAVPLEPLEYTLPVSRTEYTLALEMLEFTLPKTVENEIGSP